MDNLSDYALSLNEHDLQVYKDKLTLNIGNKDVILPDPYTLEHWYVDHEEYLPRYTWYHQLYEYMTKGTGPYDHETMENWRDQDFYKYFKSGFVKNVLQHEIDAKYPVILVKGQLEIESEKDTKSECPELLDRDESVENKNEMDTAEVNATQMMSTKIAAARPSPVNRNEHVSFEPWLYLDKESGEVVKSFCKCKQGSHEVCMHIAATLFTLDHIVVQLDRKSPEYQEILRRNFPEWFETNTQDNEVNVSDSFDPGFQVFVATEVPRDSAEGEGVDSENKPNLYLRRLDNSEVIARCRGEGQDESDSN